MKSLTSARFLAGFVIAGTCLLSNAQTLDAGATVVVVTPGLGGAVTSVASESNSSTDGTRQTAMATKSDSSSLESNPIIRGGAGGSAFASADYGVLKVFASSLGSGLAGGYADANAGFSDRFKIDAGSLNGQRGFINTKIDYQWTSGGNTSVSPPNSALGIILTLNGYFGTIQARDTFQYNLGDPLIERYISVSNPDGTVEFLPQTFSIDITTEFTFGSWLDISARLNGSTSAIGGIGSDVVGNPRYDTTSLFVNASNSAYWGGITVFSSDGTQLSDYGLESQSGTDWRQSYVPAVTLVPEPETYALMIAGLAAVGVAARRRKSARRESARE